MHTDVNVIQDTWGRYVTQVSRQPCLYGDCYDEGMNAYRCECHPGYMGTLCDTGKY